MNKQEFLAMSLPYKIKCTGATEFYEYQLLSVHIGNIELCRVKPCDGGVDFPIPISSIKPIVRPLQDLTKDCFFEELENFACELLYAASVYNKNTITNVDWSKEPFEIVMFLIKRHYDLITEDCEKVYVTDEFNPYR